MRSHLSNKRRPSVASARPCPTHASTQPHSRMNAELVLLWLSLTLSISVYVGQILHIMHGKVLNSRNSMYPPRRLPTPMRHFNL